MPGTWTPLTHQPSFSPGTMLLLTDGTVMCQDSGSNHWWRLTPDASGSYVNGSWSALADSPHAPLYYASAVLRDGRVFVAGGEFDNGTPKDLDLAWIFDPQANTWTADHVVPSPAGWTAIGDASSCMLPDGRILVGSIQGPQCAIYDPASNTWKAAAAKHNATTNEETWTLLPDETILTCDCAGSPQTEKYLIAADQWVLVGATPQNLVETASIEIGPALLLPDGRVFAIGATGYTALYTMPPIASQPGSWASGPAFPPQGGKTIGAKDAPAALLPSGNVLCVAGPVDGVAGHYLGPTYFFEYVPSSNSFAAVTSPPNGGGSPFESRMLLLPTGQVLFGSGAFNQIQVYTSSGAPNAVWKPTIAQCAVALTAGSSYRLIGRQLNGLSQANSYGDDAQMATNYPLVRLTYPATGHVTYCRTFQPSTMGVNTGTVMEATTFTVPAGAPSGSAQLSVVANGIPSDPLAVSIGVVKSKEKEKEKDKDKDKDVPELVPLGEDVESGAVVQPTDPALLSVLGQISQRLDQVGTILAQQQALITPQERPEVGEGALEGKQPPAPEGGKAAAARKRR